ncbi:MAG: FtsH protease activity modulator HflK [Bauldia sp.]|nr:FtsH protease activity modulator HflK [Bauldia sp.]
MSGGGGWRGGGNNGGPWGQGPRNQGPSAPDLEDLLRRSQDRLKRVLPGRGGSGRGINPLALIAIIVVVIAVLGYNFFTFRVEANEVGIVLRFGEVNRTATPGLNFRLPYPVESVYTPPVTTVNRVTIGQTDAGAAEGRDIAEESLMLTGDENIIDVDFSVFWVISNAQQYLFNLQNPESTVKAVAESAMRQIVGASDLQDLLTGARQVTELAVQELIQQTLNGYEAGIQITQVQLLKVDPPAQVIDAFRDVQAAEADSERVQNEAMRYANTVVPQARGQAAIIVQRAQAAYNETIARAVGDGRAFFEVYAAYREDPDVIRERIYLQTMADILSDMNKIVIDEGVSGGIVPYLPLSQLTPRGAQ